MIVEDMYYLTPAALAEMLAFLRSQHDQVRRITIHTGEDDFYYLLRDPRNEGTAIIYPTHQQSHVAGVGVMYRVLNTRLLFEKLAPGAFTGADLKLKLTVRDSFFPKNEGSLVVSFKDGRAMVVNDAAFDVEISMDIAEFSSMLMGAVSFSSLHTYGLAAISRPEFVGTVDRLFATSRRPLTTISF
jgi:predicted acetyltransferase